MNIINKRSEILFYYDITNANPNGDPLDENKPRIDEQTGHNLVTDVRLKRTIRDYLMNFKGYDGANGKDIFVKEVEVNNGIQDAKQRSENFLKVHDKTLLKNKIQEEIFNNKPVKDSDILSKMIEIIDENIKKECIDIRLFGVTLPIELNKKNKSSITYTGPVQFKMGKSLHEVNVSPFKGTGAFSSGKSKSTGEEKKQKTFRWDYFVDYSFICFAGIINEFNAKKTNLNEEDVNLLLEGMWEGTKCLISRSKFGQQPRLLIKIDYKGGYHIGDLDKSIKLVSEKLDLIRSMEDFKLDCKAFSELIDKHKDKIESIKIRKDPNLKLDNLNIKTEELEI